MGQSHERLCTPGSKRGCTLPKNCLILAFRAALSGWPAWPARSHMYQPLARLTDSLSCCKSVLVAQSQACLAMVDAWARHRRQFRAVWDAVSDGLEGKEVRL